MIFEVIHINLIIFIRSYLNIQMYVNYYYLIIFLTLFPQMVEKTLYSLQCIFVVDKIDSVNHYGSCCSNYLLRISRSQNEKIAADERQ